MNQSEEADKAVVDAIQEMAMYGVAALPKILHALSWWADVRGLRGSVVSQVENDLLEREVEAVAIQELLKQLDAIDVPDALRIVEALRAETLTLEQEIAGLEGERDAALLAASRAV